MDKLTLWAYIDGEKAIDVSEQARLRNMFETDIKKEIIAEHPDNKITFGYDDKF